MERIRVALFGASGSIGKIYREELQKHPFFELTWIAGSPKSEGMVLDGLPLKHPDNLQEMKKNADLIFFAADNLAAKTIEPRLRTLGLPVFTNASFHRMAPFADLVIPEINPNALLNCSLEGEKKALFIAKPNCALQNILLPLFPLHKRYQIKKLVVTSLQSVSGAGSTLPAHSIMDNVLPLIPGEEEKIVAEMHKILQASFPFSVSSLRVPTSHGHMAIIRASFEKRPKITDIPPLWDRFIGLPQELHLPSAPKKPVHYFPQNDRPQLSKDRDRGGGMTVSVGKLRSSPLFDVEFCALSHNLRRGGAKGTLLAAELYSYAKQFPDTFLATSSTSCLPK